MKHFFTISAFSLFVTSLSWGTLLDWDKVDWIQGNEIQTFSNVGGSGIDVTIALSLSYDWDYYQSYSKSYWTQTDWIEDAPNDNKTFGGDGSYQNQESLYLGLNFASDDRTQSYLDVTISFSQAVEGLNFNLFDVDAYGYNYTGGFETGIQFVDIIERVSGSYEGASAGSTVSHDASKILEKTNSDGTYYQGNTILNDDTSDQNDNPRSTLNLAWSDPVDTVSFRYTTGSAAVRDPGNQAIGLSDLCFHQYTAVPEANTVIAFLLFPLMGWFVYRRNLQKQKAA